MILIRTGPDKGPDDDGVEFAGVNARMKLLLRKAPRDKREGTSVTAPKLALQLSTPGRHGLFLLKRR